MIDTHRMDLTTTAGGAIAETFTPINFDGEFVGFKLILGTATAADVTIKDADGITLYTKTGLNASALILVAKNAVDAAGTAITNSFMPQPIVGPLSVTIANGGATKTLSIVLLVERIH